MYWRDNAQKGRGFSGDLPRLYEERMLCCMSPRSLAFYKVDRLDPRVTFFKIDTIVKKLEAWGEARAKKLGSAVFVPAGATAGWLARARVGMAEDARAISRPPPRRSQRLVPAPPPPPRRKRPKRGGK